jgi:hypothetical protein
MFADLPNLVQQVYESLDIGTSGFVWNPVKFYGH